MNSSAVDIEQSASGGEELVAFRLVAGRLVKE